MTSDALRVGATRLSPVELRARVEAWPGAVGVGQLVPLRSSDPVETVVAALAVRARGGVPAIGDSRWSESHWSELEALVASASVPAQAAWATFSSGSTGAPRVILRDAASWSRSFPEVTRLMSLTPNDAVLLPSPLVSSLSMFSIAHVLDAGATIVLPTGSTVMAADCVEATVLHGTPSALDNVLDLIDAGARTRLRFALIGGASLDPALRARAGNAGIQVASYYGAAELSFVAVDTDGVGLRAFAGVELDVRDGELWSRSAYAALGYLPGEIGSFRTDSDGWSTVGDLADISADGILTLRGRRDGAILTAGATVVPEDVEAVLRTLDGVKNSVVFGAPHPRLGSWVCAVIEPDDLSSPPTAATLRAACRDRLGVAQVPRRWYVSGDLPRTASGKVARSQIARDAQSERMPRLA
ncbi:acyl-CoA synthetase (AMP-forming)/AMP-acid ligase II [Okibacterium sp. HSC-33S16]|uniref:class I adenylate-forming enzyme family protein n=1 Tax=Okibacterium sp. HSC-33S16 TaxID=2910965 RepID=UPI00209D33C4|nr:AMP-binding protein [Okibacterium sp. HSC-33S16]MCP2031575.1 acyl-CoA synthetase (AMP-forming)/AMP-acid ligase II [Okibacterium sp. HSC-33S16]